MLVKLEKPEGSFPLWFEKLGDIAMPDGVCPVTEIQMVQYLESCQFHYSLDEATTKFKTFVLRGVFAFPQRKFWVYSCLDGFDRVWDIIVGKGKTPMFNDLGENIWMHGERNSFAYDPRDLIGRDFPEYNSSTGKAN